MTPPWMAFSSAHAPPKRDRLRRNRRHRFAAAEDERVTLPNIPRTAIFKYTEIPAGKEDRILGGQAVPGRSIEIIDPIRQREAKICRPVAITMPGMRVAGLLHEIGDRSEGRHINDSIFTNQRLIPRPFANGVLWEKRLEGSIRQAVRSGLHRQDEIESGNQLERRKSLCARCCCARQRPAYREDPIAAAAEYGAQFRQHALTDFPRRAIAGPHLPNS